MYRHINIDIHWKLNYKGYLSPSLKKPKEDDLQVGCG